MGTSDDPIEQLLEAQMQRWQSARATKRAKAEAWQANYRSERDFKDGFFIPNDRKKYRVGENAGFKLDDKSGIAIYISTKKPKDVPEENWLPINRKDIELDSMFRIYEPDAKKMKTWKVPQAEMLAGG